MKKLIRITTIPFSMKSLLQGQLKYMKDYYDVLAVSSDDDCFEQMLHEQGDIRGIKINMSRKITPIADLKALFKLVKLFRKEKPYIVHTHTPKAGTLGMWAAWICRVPHRLHTVAGLPLLEATGAKRKLLDIVERMTYATASMVYPNSFKMKEIIENNRYTKSKKLKVIANGSSNGIDTTYFSKEACCEDENAKKIYEELKDDSLLTFCFVGRIVKDKGINELVEAFGKLYEEKNSIRLILVGPFEDKLDPILPQTKELIKNHKGIKYVGFQKDVRPFLLASDVFVFPSYREGFPNVVMQAGAMGLPCIVSDINGCNEIVVDGENGRIIPVKDMYAVYDAMKEFIGVDILKMKEISRDMITSRYERQMVWKALLEEYQSLS